MLILGKKEGEASVVSLGQTQAAAGENEQRQMKPKWTAIAGKLSLICD